MEWLPKELFEDEKENTSPCFRPESPPPSPAATEYSYHDADALDAARALIALSRGQSSQVEQNVLTDNGTIPSSSTISPPLQTSTPISAISPTSPQDDGSTSDSSTITVKPRVVSHGIAGIRTPSLTPMCDHSYAPSFASDEDSEPFNPEPEMTESSSPTLNSLSLSQRVDSFDEAHDLDDESDSSTITVKPTRQSLPRQARLAVSTEDISMSDSDTVDTPSDNDFYHNDTTDDELQQVLEEEDARAEQLSDFDGSGSSSDDSDFSEPQTKAPVVSKSADDTAEDHDEFADDTPSPASFYDADSEMTDDTDE